MTSVYIPGQSWVLQVSTMIGRWYDKCLHTGAVLGVTSFNYDRKMV